MNKKRWNRAISLLMAAVMFVTTFAGTGMTAVAAESAQTEDIPAVNISLKPDLMLAGAAYTDEVYSRVDNASLDTGNCTVEKLQWLDGGGVPLENGMRLENGAVYTVKIVLKSNDGYSFAENATVTVNGTALPDENYVGRYDKDGYIKLEMEWKFEPEVKGAIANVALTGVPVATPGNQADVYSYTHEEEGTVQYTATGTWFAYDESTQQYQPMDSSAKFQEDGAYQMSLQLNAKPGYVFDYPEVTVNGEYVDADGFGDSFVWTGSLFYSFGTVLNEVEFAVANPVAGQSFSDTAPITATVPSGSHYTVKGNWRDEEWNFTGTFTQGKVYYFDSTIYADDGYHFTKDIEVRVNDGDLDWVAGKGKMASHVYRASLRSPIDEVILTNVPKAELGKKLQDGPFTIQVPADAKYQATGQWIDEMGNLITDETAKAGERYELEIKLEANPGFEFASRYTLKINGISHQQNSGGYPTDIYHMNYSFLEQIEQVEVTGVVTPAAGQTPSIDSIKAADLAKYEIVDKAWIDMADGLTATKFEKGHAYELRVTLEAKQGYEFAPYVFWKVGEEPGTIDYATGTQLTLYKTYSLENVIPEVRISNIPSMKAGEPARTDVSVPDGANYIAEAEWRVWNEDTGSYQPFVENFEQGKTYSLVIRAWSNTGYRFESGVTACYMDGILREDVQINDNLVYCEMDFTLQDDKAIHKVEVNIQKPVAGEHYSVAPVITVSENAGYEQIQRWNSGWIVEVQNQQCPFEDYFETDGDYGVNFGLIAKEGYVFADDLVVVVNGILLPTEAYSVERAKEMEASYFFDMTCQHIFGTEWQFDGTSHWHQCICGEKSDKAAHSGGTATCTKKAVCTACKQEYGKLADHSYGSGYICTGCGHVNEALKPTPTPDPGTGDGTGSAPEVTPTPTPTPDPEQHQCVAKTVVTKATLKKNGKIVTQCKVCGKKLSTKTIYAAKTVKLGTANFVYNGKVKSPKVIVKDSKGKVIPAKNYTVTKPKGRKLVGKYTYTIKFKGNYTGSKKLTLTVKPKSTSVSKLTKGKKQITVKWKKVSKQVTGYEIKYSTTKKFTKATTKTATVKKYKTTSKKLTKLKAKKTYYVKIRTYKTVKINKKNVKIYSGWSKVKSVKTK